MHTDHPRQASFELQPPDLSRWRTGNTRTPGVWRFEATQPGREVLVTALVHGNELCGAWALWEALEAGVRPRCGALTLAFCNLSAFDRFDPQDTDRSRFVDQDLNRLWGRMAWHRPGMALDTEQRRVLELQPVVERADWLLDLHSMHAEGPALGLTGLMPHHAAQAVGFGAPGLLVADAGHAAGTRMRDHGRFGDAQDQAALALLVECGWHGAASSRRVALDVLHRFLCASGCLQPGDLPAHWRQSDSSQAPQQLLVTHAITVQAGEAPHFTQPHRTGDVVPQKGTVIGHDGAGPVVTPYDNCVLIMPSLAHAKPGATLVRLARAV